jgi:hypothetical protein
MRKDVGENASGHYRALGQEVKGELDLAPEEREEPFSWWRGPSPEKREGADEYAAWLRTSHLLATCDNGCFPMETGSLRVGKICIPFGRQEWRT